MKTSETTVKRVDLDLIGDRLIFTFYCVDLNWIASHFESKND